MKNTQHQENTVEKKEKTPKNKTAFFSQEDRTRYVRLLQYIKPLWKLVALMLAATVVYGLTEPLIPWIMGRIIDDGFASSNGQSPHFRLIVLFVLLLNFGFLIRGGANFVSAYANLKLTQKIIAVMRCEMFAALLHLPMEYFHKRSQGEVVAKFTYDVNQLTAAVSDSVINLLRDLVTIFALLLYVFITDWQMTLMLMAAVPFVAWVIVTLSRKLRRLSRELQADMGGINHLLDEAIRGRTVIRIHNAYEQEYSRFVKQSEDVLQHSLASGLTNATISPILEIIIVLSLSAVILLAGSASFGSVMTDGKFVSFLGAIALLFPPIKRIGRVNEPIQRGLAAMESVFNFLDIPREVDTPNRGVKISRGAVQFADVSFRYGDRFVLENFNLEIKAGETVALVGESGAGKSTIAAMLAGFYMPESGHIYIDGFDASEISLAERRQALAYVTQDTVLFADTVAKNIAYPAENPDIELVKNAAENANAAEFINALEKNYEAEIGEQGSLLSGGQKQRLAIARALYKNAPILILDEATAALDNRSERKVQEAIERLQKNRTAIIIAHRLSTIENADRIVVLERGQIVEEGTHQQLMEKRGYYASLVERHHK
ncbi:MAG: ATP-binding cassette domain-containing protein [Cardiobacteriaceae bacterium]|nr:ATP-binding cassette domain-containing protein [Cardiobacteriaceae bacterium]